MRILDDIVMLALIALMISASLPAVLFTGSLAAIFAMFNQKVAAIVMMIICLLCILCRATDGFTLFSEIN